MFIVFGVFEVPGVSGVFGVFEVLGVLGVFEVFKVCGQNQLLS